MDVVPIDLNPTSEFTPETNRGKTWDDRYEELKEYWKIYGHCNVSQRQEMVEYCQLGCKAGLQLEMRSPTNTHSKRQKRKHPGSAGAALTEDQIKRLDELGFEWDRFSRSSRASERKRSASSPASSPGSPSAEMDVVTEESIVSTSKESEWIFDKDKIDPQLLQFIETEKPKRRERRISERERPTYSYDRGVLDRRYTPMKEKSNDPHFFENERKRLRVVDRLNRPQKYPDEVADFLSHASWELSRVKEETEYENKLAALQTQLNALKEECNKQDAVIEVLQAQVMQREIMIERTGVENGIPKELLFNWSTLYKALNTQTQTS